MHSTQAALLCALAGTVLTACAKADAPAADSAAPKSSVTDSTYAALLERGKEVMGVNQLTSTHVFESLPDGGRIMLQRDSLNARDIQTIRMHMLEVAARFANGDYSLSEQVHAQAVPGTAVMATRRSKISFVADTLPRGAVVRITTTDPEALAAVHEFLEFQRTDHRAAGHSPDHAHPPAK
ncbi:MAG: hypothetical protein ACO1Q7_18525 [Gemmatimonas sp.]